MRDPLGLTPAQRRAAEERCVARYAAMLTETMQLPPDRLSGPRRYDPIWPLGGGRIRCTEAMEGIFVEDVHVERSYPDTVMVVVFRFFLRPACLYALQHRVWTLSDLLKPEPHVTGDFIIHLHEWLATRFRHDQHMCRPDEPVVVRRVGSWTELLPRIVSGELVHDTRQRALALSAMAALGMEASKP